MPLTDDIRKTLTDPTPLYFAAGVIDKIREEAPDRIAAVRATDPKDVQAKVTDRAKETQARMNTVLNTIDTDIKKLREQTQTVAMQTVGYALEYAVKAREAYDELAERGRGAVQTWRGEDEAASKTVKRQPVRVAEPPAQSKGKKTGTSTAGGAKRANGTKSSNGRSTAKKTTTRRTSASGSASSTAAGGSRTSGSGASGTGSTTSGSTGSGSSTGSTTGGGSGSTTPKSDA